LSAEQDGRMALCLAKLALLSHGSTQAFNASGGQSGEPDDKMVTQVLRGDEPPHLTFRRRYSGARSDTARKAVLEAARTELKDWRGLDRQPIAASITEDEIVVRDYAGWSPKAVAQTRRLTERMVRRARAEGGRDTETGEVVEGDARLAGRAAALAGQGLTQRQIGALLGVSQSTVQRLLKIRRDV
jgi:hypothetical protein